MAKVAESPRAVLVSLACDVGIAVTKLIVAFVSGSSAMLSEGIHSSVDCMNGLFLLVGLRISRRPPDDEHPFGYGRALYFWTLIAAVSIFAGGSAMSIYEGIVHMAQPHATHPSRWTYVVLGAAAIFEAYSTWSAWREYRASRRREQGLWEAFRTSKDLTTFAVLFEQGAGLVGVLLAFAGVVASAATRSPIPDAIASIAIGVTLGVVAFLLMRESQGLLIGEATSPRAVKGIRALTERHPSVERVLHLLTLHEGPHEVLLAMDVQFRPGLSADDVVRVIDDLERAVREQFPDVTRIFVEADRLAPHRGRAAEATDGARAPRARADGAEPFEGDGVLAAPAGGE